MDPLAAPSSFLTSSPLLIGIFFIGRTSLRRMCLHSDLARQFRLEDERGGFPRVRRLHLPGEARGTPQVSDLSLLWRVILAATTGPRRHARARMCPCHRRGKHPRMSTLPASRYPKIPHYLPNLGQWKSRAECHSCSKHWPLRHLPPVGHDSQLRVALTEDAAEGGPFPASCGGCRLYVAASFFGTIGSSFANSTDRQDLSVPQ